METPVFQYNCLLVGVRVHVFSQPEWQTQNFSCCMLVMFRVEPILFYISGLLINTFTEDTMMALNKRRLESDIKWMAKHLEAFLSVLSVLAIVGFLINI